MATPPKATRLLVTHEQKLASLFIGSIIPFSFFLVPKANLTVIRSFHVTPVLGVMWWVYLIFLPVDRWISILQAIAYIMQLFFLLVFCCSV
jgi:hypothetical protein